MAADASEPSEVLRECHALFFAEPPDYGGAAKRFERVVGLRPDWVEGHSWLGSAYEALGDDDRAVEEWEIAHELDPADSRAFISLGVLRLRQRRFQEAIELLEDGIARKPHYGYADAKLFLAEALEGAGSIELAKRQWREVLQLAPIYPSYDGPMKQARERLRLHGEAD